jgi:methylisocitrate lyase
MAGPQEEELKEEIMPYLVAADLPTEPAGKRFRALLDRGGILQMPGAHNGMAALQARDAGFEAVYLSGAAMSASMGLPDLGVITVDEVCFFIRQIARASGLPVLVDGDTGYGEALNVMHMVRCFEEAGAAAVHIEDQLLPKKCGHLNDKKLAEPPRHAGISPSSRAPMPRPAKASTAPWRGPGAISRPAPTRSSRKR